MYVGHHQDQEQVSPSFLSISVPLFSWQSRDQHVCEACSGGDDYISSIMMCSSPQTCVTDVGNFDVIKVSVYVYQLN